MKLSAVFLTLVVSAGLVAPVAQAPRGTKDYLWRLQHPQRQPAAVQPAPMVVLTNAAPEPASESVCQAYDAITSRESPLKVQIVGPAFSNFEPVRIRYNRLDRMGLHIGGGGPDRRPPIIHRVFLPAPTNAGPASGEVRNRYAGLRTQEADLKSVVARLDARRKECEDLVWVKFRAGQDTRQANTNLTVAAEAFAEQRTMLVAIQATAKELETRYPDLKNPPPAQGGANPPALAQ
jgi:hypothetical protein